MSLWFRLATAMVSLVVLTALGVGGLVYSDMKVSTLPLAERGLLVRAGLVARDLSAYVENARGDVLAMAATPSLGIAIDPGPEGAAMEGWTVAHWREHLAQHFVALARAKPNYLQVRLIGADAGGMELVRVNRTATGVEVVPTEELQSKADRPYFAATLTTRAGEVYVSPLDYNRENGVLEIPHMPTLRVASAVRTPDDKLIGVVIINLDMRPALDRISRESSTRGQLYLVDENGNYLVHPDRSREFAFDLSQPDTIQQEWPQLAGVLSADAPSAFQFKGADEDYVSVTVPLKLAGQRRLTLVQLVPVSRLLAQTSRIANSTIIVGLAGALLAIGLAVLVTYSLTRPVRHIIRGIENAAEGEPVTLPTETGGEIGQLARTIGRYLQREEQLGAIVRSSADAILTRTLDGTITSANEAAERLYGYSEKELVGANARSLIPPDRVNELEDVRRRTAAGESVIELPTRRLRKDGEIRDVVMTATPLRDHSGKVSGISVIVRDVTERLADERRMRRLQAETAHAERIDAAGQMAAALAHELSQPLTAVVNYVKAAQRTLLMRNANAPAEDDVYKLIDKAVTQTERAGGIVRRLRNFIGNRSSQVEPHDINQVVEEGVETALIGAKQEGVAIVRNYAENLPPVRIDRIQIQQVVMNLVRNALEAMADSSERTLTVVTSATDSHVEVSVSDSGPGLSPDENTKLFEPFTTTKASGMGIGLSISRSIIEAHAGTLTVVPRETGSTFRFTLPAAASNTGVWYADA